MSKMRTFTVNFLSRTIGRFLVLLRPKKANRLGIEGMTVLMGHNRLSISERLMRRYILHKVQKRGKFDTLAEFHQNYWTHKGVDFFEENENRMISVHFPFCEFMFDLLKERLSQVTSDYHTLVEIGTGDGFILNHLSSQITSLNRFVGIDLNEKQTALNRKKYSSNPKLEFVASDAFEWVEKDGRAGMVFLTFMGVLEYFTQERLEDFFDRLSSLGKVVFVAIEPNGDNHDFSINPNSLVYGTESSFSHNYVKLFEAAGFQIWHLSHKKLYESSIFSFVGAELQ